MSSVHCWGLRGVVWSPRCFVDAAKGGVRPGTGSGTAVKPGAEGTRSPEGTAGTQWEGDAGGTFPWPYRPCETPADGNKTEYVESHYTKY